LSPSQPFGSFVSEERHDVDTQGTFSAGFTTAQNLAIGQLTLQQLHILHTEHFYFTNVENVINCTLKYMNAVLNP